MGILIFLFPCFPFSIFFPSAMSMYSFQDRKERLSFFKPTSTGAQFEWRIQILCALHAALLLLVFFFAPPAGLPQHGFPGLFPFPFLSFSSPGLGPRQYAFSCPPAWDTEQGHRNSRICLEAECGWSAVYIQIMSVYLRWFCWRLTEIMGRLEPPLPETPAAVGIATVLVLYFFVYLKMNLRGMAKVWGRMVRKAGRTQRKSAGEPRTELGHPKACFPALWTTHGCVPSPR